MSNDVWQLICQLPFLLRHRAVLHWQPDLGGTADALAAGLKLAGHPANPHALLAAQAQTLQSGQRVDDVQAFAEALMVGNVRSYRSPLTALTPLQPGFCVLVALSQGHWVALLRKHGDTALVLDPSIGLVLIRGAAMSDAPTDVIEVAVPAAQQRRPDAQTPLQIAGNAQVSLWDAFPEILVGAAVRLVQAFLLMLVCISLLMIQQNATSWNLAALAGLVAVGGSIMIWGRAMSFQLAQAATDARRRRAFSDLLIGRLGQRDLLGFRNLPEQLVAQRAMQKFNRSALGDAGIDTRLGALFAAAVLLLLLHPFAPLAFVLCAGLLGLTHVADRVYLAHASGHVWQRQYRRMSRTNSFLHPAKLVVACGSILRWAMVAATGLSFGLGLSSDVSLTFWILAAILLAQTDVNALNSVVKGVLLPKHPMLDAALTWVEPRTPKFDNSHAKCLRNPTALCVAGLEPIMGALRQSDLSRSEQRHVVRTAITHAMTALEGEAEVAGLRPVLLGFGQDTTAAEVHQLMIDERIAIDCGEPSKTEMQTIDATKNALARTASEFGEDGSFEYTALIALRACGVDELPVLLDLREEFTTDRIAQIAGQAQCSLVGVVSMRQLRLYRVARS